MSRADTAWFCRRLKFAYLHVGGGVLCLLAAIVIYQQGAFG